ncbi:MAG TPA: glycoside hydrolase family 44 protein [Polyangiaceae bacterium]|nr:glycoside hydrolase family 44 protein [Polyangiaceae bacterium]
MPRGVGRKTGLALGLVAAAGLAGGALGLVRAKRARHVAPPTATKPIARQRRPFEAREVIFDQGLKAGWAEVGVAQHVAPGKPAALELGGFGSWILRHERLSAEFGALVFLLRTPPDSRDFLEVSLRLGEADAATFPKVLVTERESAPLADGWSEVLIPFAALDPSGVPFDSVALEARRMVSQPVEVDKLLLTAPEPGQKLARSAPLRPAHVALDCRAEARRISPLIYGIARGVYASGESAHRIGGNAMTRLNWDLGNVWNTGSDWFFENVRGPDKGLRQWLAEAQQRGVQMALTVPMIGWVAKDDSSSGFPRSKFAAQRKYDDANRPEAGDGFDKDGERLQPGPPTQTSEEAPPERIQRWVEGLLMADAASGKRSVQQYILDNEPDLWHETHRDIHPEPLGYDELLDRTLRYGAAIRRADPQAVIAGPASWGWTGYFFSAKDMAAGAALQPDRRAHGGVPLLPWYLSQLSEHERRTGERLLDVLDVHYYPQAQGVYGKDGRTDREGAALRLRSTRSLWDPTYKDESWIDEPVQLLPRLQGWIDKYYPGRGLSLGEWSFGAEHDISGGLATAEALGRFGQLGLTSAFYWADPPAGSATFWAFRAFRNYDGKGARFLDFSVPTSVLQQGSVFASRDEASQRFVLVAVNLDAEYGMSVQLDVSSCGALTQQRVFSYSGGEQGIVPDTSATTAGGRTGVVLQPYSIAVIELATESAPAP